MYVLIEHKSSLYNTNVITNNMMFQQIFKVHITTNITI